MKTNVLMKRQIFDSEISQRSDNEFFSATDLVRAGNKWRTINGLDFFNMSEWFRQKNTKEFIEMLESQIAEKAIISGRGRGHHTWVHPYIFIDMALAISPGLKLTVYKWIHDYLIRYRNQSGDNYKKMAGALYLTIENKSNFKQEIMDIASRIKSECQVIDWQTATENQLKLRDKIQEYISIFSDIIRDRENLLDISIKKAKSEMEVSK